PVVSRGETSYLDGPCVLIQRTSLWELCGDFHPFDHLRPELKCGSRVVFRHLRNDCAECINGGLRPDYLEVHRTSRDLTSSCDFTRPSSAAFAPSRMAATVASSSLISSSVTESGSSRRTCIAVSLSFMFILC